jgi:hypothetical protein
MDDLDRLFRHLVNHLAKEAPQRLRTPFEVAELYQSVIPYRTHRRALGFEAIEDYEMAVLRLLGGQRGYATVDPVDAQEAMAAEAESVNPDPAAFREFAAATMTLRADAIRSVLDQQVAYAPPEARAEESRFAPPEQDEPQPERSYAPPAEEESLREPEAPRQSDRGPAAPAGGSGGLVFEAVEAACPHCYAELPRRRRVAFCPFCGRQVEEAKCPACGDALEPGWRFCASCGTTTRE